MSDAKRIRISDGYFSMQDVAERLQTPYRRLYRLVQIGCLPKPKRRYGNGRRTYYDRTDLATIRQRLHG